MKGVSFRFSEISEQKTNVSKLVSANCLKSLRLAVGLEYQGRFIQLFSILDIEKSLFVCWSDLKKLELIHLVKMVQSAIWKKTRYNNLSNSNPKNIFSSGINFRFKLKEL